LVKARHSAPTRSRARNKGTALFDFVWLPIALSGIRQPGGKEAQRLSTSLGKSP